MGGSALLIYGTVSDTLLKPQPVRRSLVERLLRSPSTTTPEWTQLGRTRQLISLPTDGLEKLGSEFRVHLARRFQNPWAATSSIFGYLDSGVINPYLRGDREGDAPPVWYVQLTFSGCAGMAQIASELATHWAELWYRDESDRIASELLRPRGFEPDGRTLGVEPSTIFVPIGEAGYATYAASLPNDLEFDGADFHHFEVDASVTETFDEHALPLFFRRLDTELRPLVDGRGCCCQWCSPDFDVAAIDRLQLFT